MVGVESVGALLRDGSRGYERERGEISLRLSLFPQTFDDIIHCNAIWGGGGGPGYICGMTTIIAVLTELLHRYALRY